MNQSEQLINMLLEVFNIKSEEITDDATPDDIESWTSISHMDLMARFEEKFGLELDVEEITEMDSIGAIKETLKNHGIEV
ncbi:acyl carrier protein [Promethearchaeum syntrophicum]|uniref:Acyl carrier protein n=1 Tax=Promethearchaeum syntrophicum TaxID=2594042 RepID=A0A5B9D8S8_9ARCH|nr:acyl carrier protein [Candidatus Prometheoarchaeum syntrophicum]QEE15405.1 Acyl carrier protein [Candidatus Prometheoarchaeum syntrophicum]